jgi:hypothetical protein
VTSKNEGGHTHTYGHTYGWAEAIRTAPMVAACLLVAVTAFRLSYAGSEAAAKGAGYSHADAAWYPLCIEGVIVVAGVATVLVDGWYSWVVLLSFTALSVAANVVHALEQPGTPSIFTLIMAGVPPVALPLAVHLILCTVRAVRAKRPAPVRKLRSVAAAGVRTQDSVRMRTDRAPDTRTHTHRERAPKDAPADGAHESDTRTARIVRCDPGCAVRNRAGEECAGRLVDIGTRRTHRRKAGRLASTT